MPVTNPWPEFFLDCLENLGVSAAFADGAWWVDDLMVRSNPRYGYRAESGWMRWFLPSIDGILRETGKSAAWVSRSPSGAWFWHHPRKRKVERLKLHEMIERCIDWHSEVAA